MSTVFIYFYETKIMKNPTSKTNKTPVIRNINIAKNIAKKSLFIYKNFEVSSEPTVNVNARTISNINTYKNIIIINSFQ